MKCVFSLLCSSLFILSSAVQATEVYITFDAEGNRIFSDTPSDKAIKHKIPPIQTIPALKPSNTAVIDMSGSEDQDDEKYTQARISSPSSGAVIPQANNGNITISSDLSPSLQAEHSIELLMDGRVVSSGYNTQWQLTNVDRGQHQLSFNIKDEHGQIKASSQSVTIQVQRTIARRK